LSFHFQKKRSQNLDELCLTFIELIDQRIDGTRSLSGPDNGNVMIKSNIDEYYIVYFDDQDENYSDNGGVPPDDLTSVCCELIRAHAGLVIAFDRFFPLLQAWLKTFEPGKLLLIYVSNFHVLSDLLLIYICKLHWKY
jgi:hypothetical protein